MTEQGLPDKCEGESLRKQSSLRSLPGPQEHPLGHVHTDKRPCEIHRCTEGAPKKKASSVPTYVTWRLCRVRTSVLLSDCQGHTGVRAHSPCAQRLQSGGATPSLADRWDGDARLPRMPRARRAPPRAPGATGSGQRDVSRMGTTASSQPKLREEITQLRVGGKVSLTCPSQLKQNRSDGVATWCRAPEAKQQPMARRTAAALGDAPHTSSGVLSLRPLLGTPPSSLLPGPSTGAGPWDQPPN